MLNRLRTCSFTPLIPYSVSVHLSVGFCRVPFMLLPELLAHEPYVNEEYPVPSRAQKQHAGIKLRTENNNSDTSKQQETSHHQLELASVLLPWPWQHLTTLTPPDIEQPVSSQWLSWGWNPQLCHVAKLNTYSTVLSTGSSGSVCDPSGTHLELTSIKAFIKEQVSWPIHFMLGPPEPSGICFLFKIGLVFVFL